MEAMRLRVSFLMLVFWTAIIIFGSGAVFRNTPGPLVNAIAALAAYIAAVVIAMYLIHLRGASRR